MKSKGIAVPYVIWMAIFVVIPILMIVVYAFSSAGGGFTLENFARIGSPALSSWPSSPPPSACCWATPSPASWPGRAPGSSVWP